MVRYIKILFKTDPLENITLMMFRWLGCHSRQQEGWPLLGQEIKEQLCCQEISRSKKVKGEPDCSQSFLSWEGKYWVEADTQGWLRGFFCNFFHKSILGATHWEQQYQSECQSSHGKDQTDRAQAELNLSPRHLSIWFTLTIHF